MTGFAGSVAPAGASIDPGLLASMAEAVAPLGPDRHDSWNGGQAALVHALLRTTFEDEHDRQPRSFDGETWLAGDIRVDGRGDLLRELRQAGRTVAEDAPDSDLVLHAYHAWGEACVEHLIGDFSFAIWDGRARALFCARDQFGVIPFYYAPVEGGLLFGNAMQALLVHPRLDRTLNRSTVGDYLLFGYSIDPEAGFYRSVRRLPAAHCLTWRAGELRLRRYWTAPEPSPTDPGEDPRAVIERFGHVFGKAVSDRLRAPRVACMLSGGLDSGLITAFAARTATPATRIDAYSLGLDWLIASDERHWAFKSAHHIGVPFHSISSEETNLPPVGGSYWREAPEPRFEMRGFGYQGVIWAAVDDGARVLLSGMGGDALVNRGLSDWSARLRRADLSGMIRDMARYWRHHRKRPPLRSAWRHGIRSPSRHLSPVDPNFAAEQNLDQRWAEVTQSVAAEPHRSMAETTYWSEIFCAAHPESLRLPIKARHPFFDVRLFAETMRLPPTPWQFNKAILRSIGEGILPQEVLRRPKTPQGISTAYMAARYGLAPWMDAIPGCAELDGIVDRSRLARSVAAVEAIPPHGFNQAVTLPGSLAAWLRQPK